MIVGTLANRIVKVAQGQKAVRATRRGRRRGGVAATAAAVDGRAEFRELFVSLADPSGILDMEKCGRIAALMGKSASKSGYRTGVRMASLLADIFADAADIVDRPVEDGALHLTTITYREMREVLYGTAVSYRGGGDDEPVAGLEGLRDGIAALRAKADARRAWLRAADPPGSGLSKLDVRYRGRVCRDVVREDMEGVRAYYKANGEDPIFPPEPKYIDDLFGELGPGPSSVEIVAMIRGRCPEGYEMVKVGGGK